MPHVPQGWDGAELTFIRDPKYKGVLESFSTNELLFIKKARDYIQTAYEAKGIDYEITVQIYLQNNSTFSYQSYFIGKIDLSTYKISDIGVSAEIIPTGFQNVILNREALNVDLLSTKYIGGGKDSMEQITGMPTTLFLSSYTATKDVDWFIEGTLDDIGIGQNYFTLPMDVNASEFDTGEVFNQTFGITTLITNTQKFFKANADKTVNLQASITVLLVSQGANDLTLDLILTRNNAIVLTINPDSSTVEGEATSFVFTIDFPTYNLLLNGEMSLLGDGFNNAIYSAEIFNGSLSFSESFGDTIPPVTIKGWPIFEFTARILQLYSGEVSPLESTLLGRTDSLPTSYGSDGDGSLVLMSKGKWIREFPIEEDGAIIQTINGSLDKIFKDVNGRENAGLGFEVRSGVNKVVIEKEAYFFDISDNPNYPATDSRPYITNQILDLSDVVTDEILTKEVLPDWYANEIETGYSKYEYEFIQGLKEFNTKSSFATPIKSVKNKLNITSDYRYDTQGSNKLRSKPYSTDPTEDVNGDNDIFGFDSKRDGGFVVKTDEDFILVTGGIDSGESYNLNYTPRRNLEKHGNRIRSMRLALGDEIQFLETDKNSKLITQKASESESKAENGDLVVENLTPGYWIPEAYIFEAPVNEDTIAAIQANPYGVIKIASDKWGWILEVQTN
ncbi:MAG: hypothetical protein KAR08_08995, partial [Candidatus Heimdallarchaeota archaeon]|nr:hypothetical protein [Candidatus Heimdallarchaeota archaeon]